MNNTSIVKVSTSLLFVLLSIKSFGQITTRDIADKPISKPRAYDSLAAFNPSEDLRIYIGQELFFLPKSKKWTNFKESDLIGYSNFSNRPSEAGNLKENQYHPVQGIHQYDFKSDYNNIAGKYFIVEDFLDKTDKNKYKYNEQGMYFKLLSKDLRDTAYYQIAKHKEHLSSKMIIPFIVVGNFEKQKEILLNKKLQLQEVVTDTKDINNGESIKLEKESWWECIELSIVDLENNIYMKPVFIFRNDRNNEIAVEVNGYPDLKVKRKQFMTNEEIEERRRKDEVEKLKEEERLKQRELELKERHKKEVEAENKFREDCIKSYGMKYGNYVAKGEVVIGMTKEMCLAAWGNPMDINTTTTTYGVKEQWVYSMKNYLYFENGKLTAIQN